jgi:hypothetical protein
MGKWVKTRLKNPKKIAFWIDSVENHPKFPVENH